jgi:hypothetical protein
MKKGNVDRKNSCNDKVGKEEMFAMDRTIGPVPIHVVLLGLW